MIVRPGGLADARVAALLRRHHGEAHAAIPAGNAHALDAARLAAPVFAAADTLYERHGFVDCAAFGGYPPSPHNRFMTLDLETRCLPSS